MADTDHQKVKTRHEEGVQNLCEHPRREEVALSLVLKHTDAELELDVFCADCFLLICDARQKAGITGPN